MEVELAPYADLAVSAVAAPQQIIGDPADLTVSWTVANQGTGAGPVDTWTDAVILSRNEVLGDGDDWIVGRFTHSGLMPWGRPISVRKPSCFQPRPGAIHALRGDRYR